MGKEDTPVLWCTDTHNVASKHFSNFLLKSIIRNVTKWSHMLSLLIMFIEYRLVSTFWAHSWISSLDMIFWCLFPTAILVIHYKWRWISYCSKNEHKHLIESCIIKWDTWVWDEQCCIDIIFGFMEETQKCEEFVFGHSESMYCKIMWLEHVVYFHWVCRLYVLVTSLSLVLCMFPNFGLMLWM